MNSNQLREFLHRSREWSRATRGFKMAQMAAIDLQQLADVDSGFFVYQRRNPMDPADKPGVFTPWGVFAEDEERLHKCVEFTLPSMKSIIPIMERWMLAEDTPLELQSVWQTYNLLEFGIWPLVSREEMIGAVVVARTKAVTSLLSVETATALVDVCAAQLSLALDLFLTTRIAEEASQRDLLTGLLNRRGFEMRLPDLVESSRDDQSTVVFGIVDFDDLKTVNDTYGHPAGDHALRQVANIITRHIGDSGVVARFGGDEFAVIMRSDITDAESEMMRIRNEVLRESDGYSVSVGGAIWGIDGDSMEACYQVADRRLYECKRALKVFG